VEVESPERVFLRFEYLFNANVDAVFNVAQRLLWNRSDAEDVVQTTFLKALTRIDQLRDDERVRPWLLQIAYRDAIALLRRRRDRPTDPSLLPEWAAVEPGPSDIAIASDMARIVTVALAQLEESERLAVTLRDIEDFPMRDVASIMGIGLSAAKMRVHRGRASLRVALQEDARSGL
jgi:RNA polymerase sigma-70 factor (ECF subfamily)